MYSYRGHLHFEVPVFFALDKVEDDYSLMASGKCSKVVVCFDEELNQ
jgi:hypothetical protein